MLPKDGSYVSLAGEHSLQLFLSIEYELVRADDPQRGPWKVSSRGYKYHVLTADHTELALFHWHPNTPPAHPHLHLGSSQLAKNAVISSKTHVPSGRIALEEVIQLLILDWGVVPRRSDWEAVLNESLHVFRTWRTWT